MADKFVLEIGADNNQKFTSYNGEVSGYSVSQKQEITTMIYCEAYGSPTAMFETYREGKLVARRLMIDIKTALTRSNY